MPFRGLFKQIPPGTPARLVANVEETNFIRNFLNDLQGIGCRVIIPPDKNGMGARIVVDGNSDEEPPPNYTPPWQTGDLIPYSFRVAHVSGNTYSIEAGTFYGFNQSIAVGADASFAAGAGTKYLRLKVTLTASTFAITSAAIEAKDNENDANTTLIYWYTIAKVNNGVQMQRVLGDIYDRNLPTKDEEHDVAIHTDNGYPYSSSVLAKGP